MMSKDMCQRCGVREAHFTSESGRFCRECDELNDVEQDSASVQEELAHLKEENAQLRAIVQALAEDDPYTYNDNNGKMECLFCNDSWGWASNEKHTKDHEPDCLITKARALVNVTQE